MGFFSFGACALRAGVNAMLHALCAVLLLRSRITVLMGWAFCFFRLTSYALRFTVYDKKGEGG